MDNKIKSKSYLIGLFVVFFGPLFFAMWLFYVPNSWLSSRTQNHGTLIEPAHTLVMEHVICIVKRAYLKCAKYV